MAQLRRFKNSDRWYGIFYDACRVPKSKSIPLGETDEGEARYKLEKLERQFKHGDFDPWAERAQRRESLSLKQASERFVATKAHLRPKSIRAYRISQRGILKHAPHGLGAAYLTGDHLRAFIDAPIPGGNPPSAATRRHRHRHASVFVRWMLDEAFLKRDPLEGIKVPKRTRRMPEFLTIEQLGKVLRAIEADYDLKRLEGQVTEDKILWLRDLVLVAVGTGMRLGECCALRWQDVDFESGFICVRNHETFQTKSGSERWIPLVGDAADVLARRSADRRDDVDGPALTYGDGRPLVPGYASKRFKKYVRMARLPERIKFHSLRHTCASWLVMRGVSPAIIQQVLGHADISTTMIYSHLAPDVMKSAMKTAFE